MISRFSNWINTVNTTAFRVLISIGMALSHSSAVVIAMLIFAWEPTAMQMKVLTGDAAAILTMMGFDVIQFISKRRTEVDYVQAKQGPSPVNVEAPSNVTVQPAAGAASPAAPEPAEPKDAPPEASVEPFPGPVAPAPAPERRRDD